MNNMRNEKELHLL